MFVNDYSVYISLAYGAAALVLIGNIGFAVLKQQRVKKRLKELFNDQVTAGTQ